MGGRNSVGVHPVWLKLVTWGIGGRERLILSASFCICLLSEFSITE